MSHAIDQTEFYQGAQFSLMSNTDLLDALDDLADWADTEECNEEEFAKWEKCRAEVVRRMEGGSR